MAILQKSKLHVSCNPNQNPNNFHHREWKIYPKFIWKHKRPRIAKAIFSKKSNAGGMNTCLQTIVQSNSNKNCMILAQKQTWRPVE
jgi:hypothetical protein